MLTHGLDRIQEVLEARVRRAPDFEEKYGQRAMEFLKELPFLFRLFRRAALDPQIPLAQRHFAGALAYYVAESQDFLDDESTGDTGLIDDVWIAFKGARVLVDKVGEEALAGHWRGESSFSELIGLAHNIDVLNSALPSKVLEAACEFLGVSVPKS